MIHNCRFGPKDAKKFKDPPIKNFLEKIYLAVKMCRLFFLEKMEKVFTNKKFDTKN